MKTQNPFKKLRAFSDIPNSKGFRLSMIDRAGEVTSAIVAREETTGCHYLETVAEGARLSLGDFVGWEAA